MEAARKCDTDPDTDPTIQRSLTKICARLTMHITSDWVRGAPAILGKLLPLVANLPEDQTLSDYEEMREKQRGSIPDMAGTEDASGTEDSGVGPNLTELLTRCMDFRITRDRPRMHYNDVKAAENKLKQAREKFRDAYTEFDEAQMTCNQYQTRYREDFDRLVVLMRGESFKVPGTPVAGSSSGSSLPSPYSPSKKKGKPSAEEVIDMFISGMTL